MCDVYFNVFEKYLNEELDNFHVNPFIAVEPSDECTYTHKPTLKAQGHIFWNDSRTNVVWNNLCEQKQGVQQLYVFCVDGLDDAKFCFNVTKYLNKSYVIEC